MKPEQARLARKVRSPFRFRLIGLVLLAFVLSLLFASVGQADTVQKCEGAKNNVPDGFRVVCSATWQLNGTCNGAEMWDKWKVLGRTSPNDSFVLPWLDERVEVIGLELVKLQPDIGKGEVADMNNRESYFMVGSAIPYQPDAMIFLAPGETHAKQMWPPGTGQIWPDKNAKPDSKLSNMIDLHGLCFGNVPITILLTLYYTPIPVSQ